MARTLARAPDAPLTPRQLRTLRFVADGCMRGLPPTRKELSAFLGVVARNSCQLKFLAGRGLIELVPGTKRGVRMTVRGTAIAYAKTREELLEELYQATEHELAESSVFRTAYSVRRAVDAIRDFDASAEKRVA